MPRDLVVDSDCEAFHGAQVFIARGARTRVLYGKKIIAIGHARFILEFTRGWSDVLLTDRATQDEWKSFFQDTNTQLVMRGLMRCAIEDTRTTFATLPIRSSN